MNKIDNGKIVRMSMLLLVLLPVLSLPIVYAYTTVYPWNGYPYYDTDIGVGNEGIGQQRIAPYDDASAQDVAYGFGSTGLSWHGIGADIYAPQGIDASIFVRGTYHLWGFIGALGFGTAKSAIRVYIVDHTQGDAIIYQTDIKSQYVFWVGSYDETGNLDNTPIIAISLLGGHEYYVLAVAFAYLANIGAVAGNAQTTLGLSLLSISVYPLGYLSGGGCPNICVWNGSSFVDEGVLPIHNFIDPSQDVLRNHMLQTQPEPIGNDLYMLKLSEIAAGYNYSHSFVDCVSLIGFDAQGNEQFTQLVTAIHSRTGNVLSQAEKSDNVWTETIKGDNIYLIFKRWSYANPVSYWIFTIEGHNPFKE